MLAADPHAEVRFSDLDYEGHEPDKTFTVPQEAESALVVPDLSTLIPALVLSEATIELRIDTLR